MATTWPVLGSTLASAPSIPAPLCWPFWPAPLANGLGALLAAGLAEHLVVGGVLQELPPHVLEEIRPRHLRRDDLDVQLGPLGLGDVGGAGEAELLHAVEHDLLAREVVLGLGGLVELRRLDGGGQRGRLCQ